MRMVNRIRFIEKLKNKKFQYRFSSHERNNLKSIENLPAHYTCPNRSSECKTKRKLKNVSTKLSLNNSFFFFLLFVMVTELKLPIMWLGSFFLFHVDTVWVLERKKEGWWVPWKEMWKLLVFFYSPPKTNSQT